MSTPYDEERLLRVYRRACDRHSRRVKRFVMDPGASYLNLPADEDRLLRQAFDLSNRILSKI